MAMQNYITITNDYFEILIPIQLKEYGNEVLEYSTDRLKEFLSFFKVKNYNKKIKSSFLITYDDFINRIQEVSTINSTLPPKWATGCFCGGEIQILIDKSNPYKKFHTLSHESFHLLFSEFVYDKNKIQRIIWLDESLAINFDGTVEKIVKNNMFKEIIIQLINNNKLPKMKDLSFSESNIITKEYNGYDLFKVVGRYLIETKQDLLNYISEEEKVVNDGENILEESLNYFMLKYNL